MSEFDENLILSKVTTNELSCRGVTVAIPAESDNRVGIIVHVYSANRLCLAHPTS